MKFRLFLLLLLIAGAFSCAEDRPAPQVLKTSEQSISFSGKPGAWMLTVNSNTSWTVENETDWCKVDKTAGVNTENLVVSVDSNNTGAARSTVLHLVSELHNVDVTVNQDVSMEEYFYKLPVVFHIIYDQDHNTPTDTVQNIKAETIAALVEGCNALYRQSNNSTDMGLELVPVTEDPDGNVLQEAGIDRVLRTNSAYRNADDFLASSNTQDAELMWNPNQYVNVYVFTCTDNSLLGVSHLALTSNQNGLAGLERGQAYYTQIPNFPWGIVLNNTHIYEEDAYTTLAHELGHYLGLFHAFSENGCDETDYCDDTQNYDRTAYTEWLSTQSDPANPELYQRTDCETGVTFTSDNIMDYDYSHLNRFTPDQYLRVRHVLENSPLIPGPKNISVTKSMTATDLPVIRIMR